MNIQARTWIVALVLTAGAGVALAAGDDTNTVPAPAASGTAAGADQGGWHQRGHAWGPQSGGPGSHGPGFRGGRFGGRGRGARFARHRFGGGALLHEIHQLNLTQAQEQSIRDVLKQARTQAMASRKTSLAALDNPGDPNYASAVESAKRLAAERIQTRSDTQTKIYNVLSEQQKNLVNELLANRQAKLQQMRARWQARQQQGRRGQHRHGQHPGQNPGQGQSQGQSQGQDQGPSAQ